MNYPTKALHVQLSTIVQQNDLSDEEKDDLRYSIAGALLIGFMADEVPDVVSDWAIETTAKIEARRGEEDEPTGPEPSDG